MGFLWVSLGIKLGQIKDSSVLNQRKSTCAFSWCEFRRAIFVTRITLRDFNGPNSEARFSLCKFFIDWIPSRDFWCKFSPRIFDCDFRQFLCGSRHVIFMAKGQWGYFLVRITSRNFSCANSSHDFHSSNSVARFFLLNFWHFLPQILSCH